MVSPNNRSICEVKLSYENYVMMCHLIEPTFGESQAFN